MNEPADESGTEPEVRTFGNYRRKPITTMTGRFTGLGDGLSKSMEIEGEPHEPGTWVTHVVRSKVGPHRLDLNETGKDYTLDETYKEGTVALIDEDLVIDVLTTMERRIKEREDAGKGKLTLAGVDDAADEAKGAPKLKSVPDALADDGGGASDAEGFFDGASGGTGDPSA